MASTYAAFFYGTLMASTILNRVTGRTDQSTSPPLVVRPAHLPIFRRYRVRGRDYPALRAVISMSEVANKGVIGTYVTGLTETDMRRLDAFEGDEYRRCTVRIRILPEDDGVYTVGEDGGIHPEPPPDSDEWLSAETYIWAGDHGDLEEEEWDFEDFCRTRLGFWNGEDGDEGFQAAANVEERPSGSGNTDENRDMSAVADTTGGRSVQGGEFERKVQSVNGTNGMNGNGDHH